MSGAQQTMMRCWIASKVVLDSMDVGGAGHVTMHDTCIKCSYIAPKLLLNRIKCSLSTSENWLGEGGDYMTIT